MPSTAQLIVASTENEWYTPTKYLDAARSVLGGIDLDPASSLAANQVVQARDFFTKDQDGLSLPWIGRVWLNPPYGRQAGDFVRKLLESYRAGSVSSAICLVNAHCTDTRWFQGLWEHTLCFTDHRIDFESNGRDKHTKSTHGSVFAYLGSDPLRFRRFFSPFGVVVRRY